MRIVECSTSFDLRLNPFCLYASAFLFFSCGIMSPSRSALTSAFTVMVSFAVFTSDLVLTVIIMTASRAIAAKTATAALICFLYALCMIFHAGANMFLLFNFVVPRSSISRIGSEEKYRPRSECMRPILYFPVFVLFSLMSLILLFDVIA